MELSTLEYILNLISKLFNCNKIDDMSNKKLASTFFNIFIVCKNDTSVTKDKSKLFIISVK